MTRLRGRCRRGQRLIGKIPLARWHTTTFVAALRLDRLTAPMVLEGPIDGAWFLAYVEQVLCPTLAPGDIVILDNLGSHTGDKIQRAIEAHGARLLFLPKYSPDLNPIEKAWSKVKEAVRRAQPRTTDALIAAVGAALLAITPQDIQGWFTHCGYHTDS